MIDRVTRLCYKVAPFIVKIFMNPRYIFIIYIIYLVMLLYIYPKNNHLLGGCFSIYHCLLEEELELLELSLLDSELSSEELVLSNCSGWSAR